jgi:hypothetical protein
MSEALTVYLHFPCFDGVVSAALVCEYMERKYGQKTGKIVPVNYSSCCGGLPLPSRCGLLGRSSSDNLSDTRVGSAIPTYRLFHSTL